MDSLLIRTSSSLEESFNRYGIQSIVYIGTSSFVVFRLRHDLLAPTVKEALEFGRQDVVVELIDLSMN